MKFCLLYFLSYFLSDQFSSFKIRPKHYLSKQIPSSLSLKSFILKSTIYDEIVSDSSCVYDKDRVEDFYSSRPLLVLNRLIEVGTPVFEWWISKKIDSFLVKYRTVEENQYYVKQRASELRVAIVKGKSVTFIKSGQALALRPDIIKSVDYIQELTKLQDEVGVFDNKIAFEIMRSEFGADPFSIYDFDSTTPIASASIGQVYKARLKDTNISVAVKVQRPEALSSASLDIFILRKLAFLVKKLRRLNTDLVSIADQFGGQLFQELDYNSEARNCLRFRELYGGIAGIYVPFAYTNLTRQRVLTMEFVEGVKGPWKTGGERMLTVGLQCSVTQLLESGYFHSDPHRGNLLQTPDGKLAYLDFGMMADVPMIQRYALVGTVLGLVNKDIPLVISSLKDLDFLPPNANVTEVVQVLDRAIYSSTENGSGSSLNFTRLNQNLNEAAVSGSLPFRLPPFYSLIIRTLTILEGLALSVDKDFKLIRGAYPFVAKQVLTAQSPEMTRLLRSVLIDQEGRIRWAKLEQFLSIASNADSAINGNFAALKRAQSRSDFLNTFTENQEDSNFTADTIIQILNFLDSENGQFIREPLVNEIVDGLDNLGLTVATLASILTNEVIPAPSEKPDREKIQQLARLLTIFWEIAQSSLQKQLASMTPANATSIVDISLLPKEVMFSSPGLLLFLKTLQQTVAWTSTSLQSQVTEMATGKTISNDKVITIVRSFSGLLLAVLAQLAIRLTRRGVKTLVSTDNVKSTLPAVTRLLSVSVRILNMFLRSNADRE